MVSYKILFKKETVFGNPFFIIKLLFCSPKIIWRYIYFSIQNKKVKVHTFKVNSNYCAEGTLNQLTWFVDNATFILVNNSQKIFFGSNEIIFKVNKNYSTFKLTCFGVGDKKIAIIQIKIIEITKRDYEDIKVKENRFAAINYKTELQPAFQFFNGQKPVLEPLQIDTSKLIPIFKKNVHPNDLLNQIKRCNSLEEVYNIKESINQEMRNDEKRVL